MSNSNYRDAITSVSIIIFRISISGSAKKKAPLFSLIANPQKAKNDDKVTFLERISEKYLVTQRNFCNFAVHLAKCPNDPINGKL